MSTSFVLLGLFVAVFSAFSYEGFQVLRVTGDADKAYSLARAINAEVFSANKIEQTVDILVSPQHSFLFKAFPHVVIHEDLEASINSHLDENQAVMYASAADWNFDSYPQYDTVKAWLNKQLDTHKDKTKPVHIGKTYLGEDIIGISIGDASKKKLFMHCTIHAREWVTTTTCMWIIDQLLNQDADREKLTSNYNWIIVPVHNVDGYRYTHTNTRLWRKNRQPNAGTSCVGTDLNRNYGFQWSGPGSSKDPCSEVFRGAAPFSSPESKAENDFLAPFFANNSILAYVDIHAYGGYWMSPWGYTEQLPKDYEAMSNQMKASVEAIRAVNGRRFTQGSIARVLYASAGSTVDQTYGAGNIVHSYALETYGNSFILPVSEIKPVGREIWAGIKSIATRHHKKQRELH